MRRLLLLLFLALLVAPPAVAAGPCGVDDGTLLQAVLDSPNAFVTLAAVMHAEEVGLVSQHADAMQPLREGMYATTILRPPAIAAERTRPLLPGGRLGKTEMLTSVPKVVPMKAHTAPASSWYTYVRRE